MCRQRRGGRKHWPLSERTVITISVQGWHITTTHGHAAVTTQAEQADCRVAGAGRARAPPTELRRPAPPRWEAPANCRRPSRSTFTARVSSRYPRSSVKCQVETCTGAGPSRNNVEQCLGVMVVQPSGVYCCSIRFMDHMTKSRPVWARASRARARQPRLPGVVAASESVSRAVTTQAERADCRPRARASD